MEELILTPDLYIELIIAVLLGVIVGLIIIDIFFRRWK